MKILSLKIVFLSYIGITSLILLISILMDFNYVYTNFNTGLKLILSGIGVYSIIYFFKNKFKVDYSLLFVWWIPQILIIQNIVLDNVHRASLKDNIYNACILFNLLIGPMWQKADGSYFALKFNIIAIAGLRILFILRTNEDKIE